MENISSVNCKFCKKEMECPEDMIYAEIHSCTDCFKKNRGKLPSDESKIHVDMTDEQADEIMPEILTGMLVEDIFPEIWNKELKDGGKNLSRKELAMIAFASGAESMIGLMKHIMKEDAEIENKIKIRKRSAK